MKAHIASTEINKLQNLLEGYTFKFRGDIGRLLVGHSRSLARDLVKYTPKIALETDEFGPKKTGELAVIRDIRKAVTPFDNKVIFKDRRLGKRLKEVAEGKKLDALNAILNNIPAMRKWSVVPFSPDLHESVRIHGDRIRVTSNKRKLTLDVDEWNKYANKVRLRVGKLKAYWVPMCNKFAVPVAAYIQRHAAWAAGQGTVEVILGNRPRVRIEITHPKYRAALQSAVNIALPFRIGAMIRDLEAKIKYSLRQKTHAAYVSRG